MDLDQESINSIARAVITQAKDSKHAFWIEPETHYQDHLAMRDMVKMFSTTRSLFFRAFLGFAIIGTIVLSAIGLGFSFK